MSVVDFHNHLMPGVDDGAQDANEATEGLLAFKADGVERVVATPHIDGSLTLHADALATRFAQIDRAWQQLQKCARDVDVVVERGVELKLDIPNPDLSDLRLYLAGGEFMLIEFPFMTVPPLSTAVLKTIISGGCRPIIAHPERYTGLDIALVGEWRQAGALLQVNGGSLLGRYGREALRLALELLQRGWADYLSSDYHARGEPMVAQYRAWLENQDAVEQAHMLMETNPTRMLQGLAPLPVPRLPVEERKFMQRVMGMFGSR